MTAEDGAKETIAGTGGGESIGGVGNVYDVRDAARYGGEYVGEPEHVVTDPWMAALYETGYDATETVAGILELGSDVVVEIVSDVSGSQDEDVGAVVVGMIAVVGVAIFVNEVENESVSESVNEKEDETLDGLEFGASEEPVDDEKGENVDESDGKGVDDAEDGVDVEDDQWKNAVVVGDVVEGVTVEWNDLANGGQ